MNQTIYFDIVSLDSKLFSNKVRHIVISASHGDLEIHPGHAPLLTLLKPGLSRVVHVDGCEEVIYISGGFIEVQPHRVIVVADFVERELQLEKHNARATTLRTETYREPKKRVLGHQQTLEELTETSARLRAVSENREQIHIFGKKSRKSA